ncbi:N-acetylmuramoyl-L-alanine amidase [Clostridium acidisoli DSM 12555]|jgi:N-acetylmuramoyl-L-alanine amidase|uniref:Spore cortex-lytic enzyme n=1 Tax=Clostridium acidisoli DSM 12555 TaxID=1121291 RepID=A0A1W1XJ08_9CLOT|nr:spore cortex-lytic enzyme [Clostridium acidisoli]SMC23817.1 N-acetylmuramoyl-L-alanine amidase [Clostridium acidisoli DSM 12555]
MLTIKKKKYMFVCIVVILVSYSVTSIVFPFNNECRDAASYKYGASGAIVTQIQTKLKNWGYYKGNVDGKFGYNTYLAVKAFQGKNGLKSDGIAGDSTLAALGINQAPASTSKYSGNSQELMLLARLINGEARGEPYEGQVAVGSVVINRTRDPRFPSTIAGVIYAPGAFTATVDGQINAKIEQNSINAARDALNGWDPSGGAFYYFNPAKTTNAWIWSRPLIKIIGKHRFCR